MNAILLAAGVGRRLHESTQHQPKCLLPMGAQHLLGRTLEALAMAGVGHTTIVVGYRAEAVREAAGPRCGRMAIDYVMNPEYERGSVVSLWQARSALAGDVLVMDADVLFPRLLLQRLVESPHASCILLDGRVAGSGEEMILFAAAGRVWTIVRRQPGTFPPLPPGVERFDTAGESVGFLKVGAAHAPVLRTVLAEHVDAGRRDDDHELVYPAFFARCPVGYERVDDLPWTEIDFAEDVERARSLLPLIVDRES
jgi:choline kinase